MLHRLVALLALAGPVAACGGFDLGPSAPVVAKTDPGMTAPPAELRNGTAVETGRRP